MDGDVCDDYEDITYEYDDVSRELRQTDNNKPLGTDNPEVFIDNIVQFEFRYYTENDDDTPTDNDIVNGEDLFSAKYNYNDPMDESERQDIRTVEISLEVEEPAGRGGMIPREYTTRVRLRNAGL